MPETSTPESGRESPAADHDAVLRELQEKQQRALGGLQKARATDDTGIVYHYTNDVGLYEILKSGELWISDYASLTSTRQLPSRISARQWGAHRIVSGAERRGGGAKQSDIWRRAKFHYLAAPSSESIGRDPSRADRVERPGRG